MLAKKLQVDRQLSHEPGLEAVVVEVVHMRDMGGYALGVVRRVEAGDGS